MSSTPNPENESVREPVVLDAAETAADPDGNKSPGKTDRDGSIEISSASTQDAEVIREAVILESMADSDPDGNKSPGKTDRDVINP